MRSLNARRSCLQLPVWRMTDFLFQHSFARGGDLRHEDGRFLSRSSGLFMVSVTVHVKTEMLVIPGLKKKLKMKSKKVAKTQMKLQIVVNSKLKDRR